MAVSLKACILVKTAAGKYGEVARTLANLEGVKRAFPVMGRTDVVVWAEVSDMRSLGRLTYAIGRTEDVVATETLIGAEW